MLFHVRMDVNIPHDLPESEAAEIIAKEKAYSQALQRSGKWRHIWRIAGAYANYSVFDVKDNAELHEILSGLPLFKLPGDIVLDRPGMKVFFPITTMIVISLVVSLLLWLFRR